MRVLPKGTPTNQSPFNDRPRSTLPVSAPSPSVVLRQLASCLTPTRASRVCTPPAQTSLSRGSQLSPNPPQEKVQARVLSVDGRSCDSSLGPDVILAVPCQEPSPCHPGTSARVTASTDWTSWPH